MADHITGFNKKEKKVADALIEAYNAFIELPVQHPEESREFASGIHVLQGILAFRILRRDYPAGYPTHKEEQPE